MFWKKKKDDNDDKSGRGTKNDSRKGNENGEQKKGGLIQKLFRDGCDSDFVYYEE
jgi:hypothetical protein